VADYLTLLLLGVVQGFTEFLPVSSSGHLVLLETLTGFNPPGVVVEVALHVATLLAVLIYYFRDAAEILRFRPGARVSRPGLYFLYLALATAVTVAFIYPLRHFLEGLTEGPHATLALVFTFTATALMMIAADRVIRSSAVRAREVTSLGILSVLAIGLVQGIAALPGISRSGSTIFAGLLLGLRREEAARFSFLLFVPAAILAAIYELLQLEGGSLAFPPALIGPLIVGFLAALVCGLLAIRFLLAVLHRARLSWFAVYLVVAALVSLSVSRW